MQCGPQAGRPAARTEMSVAPAGARLKSHLSPSDGTLVPSKGPNGRGMPMRGRGRMSSSGRSPLGDTGGRPALRASGHAPQVEAGVMRIGERKLSWVVCHRATRTVSRSLVHCPLRGPINGATCLGCRYLTTSSIERDGPWCDAWSAPRRVQRRAPARVPIPVGPPPLPADWPLRLPLLVPRHAVRPPAPVPSGHGIGT